MCRELLTNPWVIGIVIVVIVLILAPWNWNWKKKDDIGTGEVDPSDPVEGQRIPYPTKGHDVTAELIVTTFDGDTVSGMLEIVLPEGIKLLDVKPFYSDEYCGLTDSFCLLVQMTDGSVETMSWNWGDDTPSNGANFLVWNDIRVIQG